MPTLYIDFETRSTLDLRAVGLWNYARHPSTDVWCMAYAFGGEEPRIWTPPFSAQPEQWAAFGPDTTVVAHNAAFELAIWNEIMVPRHSWPVLQPEQVVCTMAACYAMSLPGALEDAALALGLPILKETEGRALMLRMARPRSHNPLTWWDDDARRQRLYAYCAQDVRVEREIYRRVMPLGAGERKVWLADYAINQRGVAVDTVTVRAGIEVVEQAKARINVKLDEVTGGAVKSATAVGALKEWALDQGVPVASLAKADITGWLADPNLLAPVAHALRLRQEAGKSSVAKLDKIIELVGEDGRLHNAYAYHAAGTGRWAGRGVQPHNLPRDVPEEREVEAQIALIRGKDARAVDMIYGPPITVLSRLLRPLLIPKQGHVLVGGDWSAIEGRGVAWFAGEQWKLDAFRAADAGTGPGIYELTASRMLGKPVADITKAERQQFGKVPELAFGYQGGGGAAQKFGFKGTDLEARALRDGWRAEHPATVRSWRELNASAIVAVQRPGEKFSAGSPGRSVTYKVSGSFLWCLLPSGRAICYPYPKVLRGAYGPQVTYMAVPSANDHQMGRVIDDPANTTKWSRIGAHGGLFLENVVQGFCADFLRDTILACEDARLPVVIHTHDDVWTEVPLDQRFEAQRFLHEKMNTPSAWAKDFPLTAEVTIARRYGC